MKGLFLITHWGHDYHVMAKDMAEAIDIFRAYRLGCGFKDSDISSVERISRYVLSDETFEELVEMEKKR